MSKKVIYDGDLYIVPDELEEEFYNITRKYFESRTYQEATFLQDLIIKRFRNYRIGLNLDWVAQDRTEN